MRLNVGHELISCTLRYDFSVNVAWGIDQTFAAWKLWDPGSTRVILRNAREHLVIAFVSKRRILYSKCIHSLQSEAFIIFKNIAVPCGNKPGEIWRKKTICNYRSTSVYVSEIRAISAIIHTPRNTHTHTYIHDTPPWKAHSTHIGNLWRKKDNWIVFMD